MKLKIKNKYIIGTTFPRTVVETLTFFLVDFTEHK